MVRRDYQTARAIKCQSPRGTSRNPTLARGRIRHGHLPSNPSCIEPTDERYGKAGVAYLDANGKDVPVPRQFDIAPEEPAEPREIGNGGVELKRDRYRELLLANSPLLQSLQMDTAYEELGRRSQRTPARSPRPRPGGRYGR